MRMLSGAVGLLLWVSEVSAQTPPTYEGAQAFPQANGQAVVVPAGDETITFKNLRPSEHRCNTAYDLDGVSGRKAIRWRGITDVRAEGALV